MTRARRVLTREQFEQSLPVLISTLLHLALIAVLSLWLAPAIRRAGIWLDTPTALPGDLAIDDTAVRIEHPIDVPDLAFVSDLPTFEPLNTRLRDVLPPAEDAQEPAEQPVGSGSLKQAATVESAVDGITQSIQSALQHGDLTVVWLLDASFSLVDDRQRIATRLESFLADTPGAPGHLANTVVSFGKRSRERVGTTESRDQVVRTIKNLPIDPTGTENVFGAVAHCVSKYRSDSRQLILVVWTDESGDDAEKLESVIELCRSKQVAVHVVGPTAVLGSSMGLDPYTNEENGGQFLLEVTRGPDTAIEERLRLDYWFLTRPPTQFIVRGGFKLPVWYGGPNLLGISSPFSPFALTRLAIETGGTFTILDNPDDRPPFTLEQMEKYLPDYSSAEDYAAKIAEHPLRVAVLEAVRATRGSTQLEIPPLLLFGTRTELPPYRVEAPYLKPSEFARKLRSARAGLIRQAERTGRLVDQALEHVSRDGDIDKGLEALRAQEDSPRWLAWYDLTRGRLLAANVRLEEYRLTCETLADRDILQSSTNFLLFQATRKMKSGPDYQRRAQEAQQLLTRCAREHAGTPWAYLARRELDYAWGITIQQHALEPTGMVPSRQQPSLPNF